MDYETAICRYNVCEEVQDFFVPLPCKGTDSDKLFCVQRRYF